MEPFKPVGRFLYNTYLRSMVPVNMFALWDMNIVYGVHSERNPIKGARRIEIAPSLAHQALKAYRNVAFGEDDALLDPWRERVKDIYMKYWKVMA